MIGRRLLGIGLLAVLGLLLATACSGGDSDDDATPAATATATATSTPDSGGDDAELFGGQTAAEYYQTNCSACHGANREGIVGPALLPDTLTQDNAFYEDTITNGRPGTVMPAWGTLGMTAADIAAMVEFLKTTTP